MKRGELAKKKRKGCLTALLVVWAVFIVKVIAVLNPGFPEAWRMVEAGQIAGFAYIWLLVFLVLLCCFVLWRIVPKGYFRKKKPETSRPAGEWAVSIPTHENPVVVGNPFRGSSAAKFSLLASSAMVISPVSPNFSKMIPALNPIFVFSMIKFIFMYQKYVYILLFKTCRNTNLNSPPLLEKINNLYIKLFSSSKWNDYFRGY